MKMRSVGKKVICLLGLSAVLTLGLTGCKWKGEEEILDYLEKNNDTAVDEEEQKDTQEIEDPDREDLEVILEDLNKVENNGGRFVSYQNNLYYWKMSPASIEETGLMGYFSQTGDTGSQLICQAEDGSETVLTNDKAEESIWICGDYLYYEQAIYEWCRVDLDGSNKVQYKSMDICGVDSENEMVIYEDVNEMCLYSLSGDNSILLENGDVSYLGCREDDIYYTVYSGGVLSAYKIKNDGTDKVLLGTIEVDEPGVQTGFGVGSSLLEDDGIYISYGYSGGTGYFFSGGGVSRIGYDGGMETVIDYNGPNALQYWKIYIENNPEGRYLYYYCGESISEVASIWNDIWVETNVQKINLADGTVSDVDFPLNSINGIIYRDNCIQTLLDDSGQHVTILSPEMIRNMGYEQLGMFEDGSAVYLTNMDIVGEKAYYTITSMIEDSSVSMGWRQGYRRGKMQVYEVTIGSEDLKLLHEY